jgi:hypothetical protein
MFDKENNDDNPLVYPLCWGMRKKDMQEYLAKHHPQVGFYHGSPSAGVGKENIVIGDLSIFNFVGDCGAVYLCGANQATQQELDAVLDLMSECGFSKIFATIVQYPKYTKRPEQVFLDAGFTIVDDGFSNRNDEKRSLVLFKKIDCKYKGY